MPTARPNVYPIVLRTATRMSLPLMMIPSTRYVSVARMAALVDLGAGGGGSDGVMPFGGDVKFFARTAMASLRALSSVLPRMREFAAASAAASAAFSRNRRSMYSRPMSIARPAAAKIAVSDSTKMTRTCPRSRTREGRTPGRAGVTAIS